MNSIVIGAELRAKLIAGEPIQIEDEAGYILARIEGAHHPATFILTDPVPPQEELDRRFRTSTRYTAEQAAERLTQVGDRAMRVEWTEEALDRLADLMVATDLAGQDRLEEAFNHINRILADDPWEHGESRGTSDIRIWFTSILAVGYTIDPDHDQVVITFVSGLKPSQS